MNGKFRSEPVSAWLLPSESVLVPVKPQARPLHEWVKEATGAVLLLPWRKPGAAFACIRPYP